MARQARVKSEFGIFHIVQHGGSTRKLFESNADRKKFIDILNRSKNKFNFKLHGYCLAETNTYILIIDVNGGDLSKIMKSNNISYAMYAKCDGKLFSDRFKSHPIESEEALHLLKEEILQRRDALSGAEGFSNCFDDCKDDELMDLHLDDCNNCIKCMNTAAAKLDEVAADRGITVDELIKDKEQRNHLLRTFRQRSTLSLKSLGELFGGLTESSVSKIINR
jgi:hypothetical protein